MLLCVHSSKSGQVYFLCEMADYFMHNLCFLIHIAFIPFFVSPISFTTLWTVSSFLIPDNHHCYFIYILSLVSGVEKTKSQMLQILLPSVKNLNSSWGDWRHGLRYPNRTPFIYQKAAFYTLTKLSTRSNPNAYWLTYIVHTPILASLAVHDFSSVCSGCSAKVLCCTW